jgi:hypothetical protein
MVRNSYVRGVSVRDSGCLKYSDIDVFDGASVLDVYGSRHWDIALVSYYGACLEYYEPV